MATADDHRETDNAEMGCRTARRARKILAVIALSYLGVTAVAMFLFGVGVLLMDRRARDSLVRGAVKSFLHLPLFCVVPWIAFNALLTAEIVVELLRLGTHPTRSWSDKRHPIIVSVVWIALLLGQLAVVLPAR